jgi:hypothetical protein
MYLAKMYSEMAISYWIFFLATQAAHNIIFSGSCTTLCHSHMHQVPYISENCLDLTLTHLTIVGGINGVPWQACTRRFWLSTKGDLKSHRPLPPYYHFTSYLPYIHPIPLVRALEGPLRDYTFSCGKKGLKAQEVKATGKR